jgi:hypothetical protein
MNRLDQEILKAILIDQKSKYGLEAYLKKTGVKSNYTTVWRHINKMKKDGFLTIIKQLDKRRTEKPILTLKGMATLIIEGNLQKKELRSAIQKILQNKFSHIPDIFWRMIPIEAITDIVLKIKPKVNLKYFDEEYFLKTLVTDLFEMFNDEPFVASFLEKCQKINLTEEELLKIYTACNKVYDKEGLSKQPLKDSLELGKQLGSNLKKKEQKE